MYMWIVYISYAFTVLTLLEFWLPGTKRQFMCMGGVPQRLHCILIFLFNLLNLNYENISLYCNQII